jgi:hypothetical protein
MSVLQFPIRSITWGLFSERMNSFVSLSGIGTFNTWAAAKNCLDQAFSPKTQEKEKVYPKPKKVYVYGDISEEDI